MVVVIVVAIAAPARADSPAAAAFAAGTAAYNKGDYTTAIVAYEAAFRLDARAELAFTLAQAHRNQYFIDHDVTHLQRALGLYRHYLAEAPDGRRAAHARLHLETVEAILATLPPAPAEATPTKPQPTQLLVTADAPGARAAIDGGALAAVPLVADVTAGAHRVRFEAKGYDPVELDALAVAERLVVVPAALHAQPATLIINTQHGAEIVIDGHAAEPAAKLAPGMHRITVLVRGRQPETREVELGPGGNEVVTVALLPTARRRAARWTLYAAGGLGGAALVSGGFAWLAQHDALAIPPPGPQRAPDDITAYNDAVARRDALRSVSLGLAITGGAVALTGAALWYFDMPRPPEQAPTLAPVIGPESVGAAVVGRF
jgi:tetratricopeptide (TPR) repeat protein